MADPLIPQQTPQQAQNTFNAAGQQPAAQAPVTPTPQLSTPAAPTTNINISNGQTPPEASTPATNTSTAQSPTGQSQLGGAPQDVQNLQNYLVQMGYLKPEQLATGPGTYGPQTTAAVAKMQGDLGINPTTPSTGFDPQTQQILAQKYQAIHAATQGTQPPENSGQARTQLQGTEMNSSQGSNPVYNSISSSMQPIMQSLSQVLQNINNPSLTATSLQQEYTQLREQYGLPEMQSHLMNLNRIMNGTIDDVRDEVAKTGGLVTESQVQGIAAARNKTLMKQYNSLSTQFDAAQQNVQSMMQYASTDQSNQLQRTQMTATVTGSLAQIQSQMLTMGMTMQNNARQAVQYNVTQMGYKGLAGSIGNDPQMKSYYENMLGLSPGTLSDQDALKKMDTYKDQQLLINQYRAAAYGYNAGYGGSPNNNQPGPTNNTPGQNNPGQVGVNPVDPTTLVRPPSVGNSVPLSLSAEQMQSYMTSQKSAHTDPGTNNVVAPGIGYYMQQSDGSYVLKAALPSPTDSQYQDIKKTMDNAGVFKGSPTITRKWTLSANSAISSFKDTGTYKIASNVAPYLAAIHAAAANPGDKSISDFELLDSFVKAAKGGTGQVTDSQINVMLHGATLQDKWDVLEAKLNKGGTLGIPQREALVHLADETYRRNLQDYQKGYVQAVQAMQGQGIPPQFWRNLPDFTSLTPVQ